MLLTFRSEKALSIQMAYRQHLARKEYNKLHAEKCKKERMDLFNSSATKFQKVFASGVLVVLFFVMLLFRFRGWYTRKYVLDFYKRQQYLRNIEDKVCQLSNSLQL